jgi:tetratricopeptide (TPR) repeat protein
MDPNGIMQRADDIRAIQHMLTDEHTCAVVLVGNPGVGKSTLATLIYHRLLLAKQAGMPAPRHLVWLRLNSYTTIPDLISAMLQGVGVQEPDLFLLPPEQQIGVLWHALRRTNENALIVLDQFEALLHPETKQGVAGRGSLPLFLSLLQSDLGATRILLTSYHAPFPQEVMEQTRLRSYLVSRISLPEGVALLQQRGVRGTPEELSLVWQRCSGHVFALLFFSALLELSGIAPGYLSLAPEYSAMWNGEVAFNLLSMLHRNLNPLQRQTLRALSLFNEPVPLQAITMTLSSGKSQSTSDIQQLVALVERELQILARLSLVQVMRDAKGVYFSLHMLLRQYFQSHYVNREQIPGSKADLSLSGLFHLEQGDIENQESAIAHGHTHVASYYYALAQSFSPTSNAPRQARELEPLVSAIRHLCLGWQWQHACDLLFREGLHEDLVRLGAWNVLIGMYTSLLPPFGMVARRDAGLVTSHLAMLYGRIGELEQSQSYFDQALTLQHESQDTYGEAVTLANQGELYRMRGNSEQAHLHFERAILISRQQNQQSQQQIQLQSIVLHNMGLLYGSAKDYTPALSCYIQALRLTYKLQKQYNKGIILTNLGMLLYEQGKQRESVAILLAALQLRQLLQDPSVVLLERFLIALEQHMGAAVYANLCQSALSIQQHVIESLVHDPTPNPDVAPAPVRV